jgi:formamidopyrimidine-DNA glycosylase
MPELPEVEVVRRGIADWVVGRTIAEVQVLHPRATRAHILGERDFCDRLAGRTVSAINRRGKFMWLVLDDDSAVVIHLGMSGQVLVQPTDADPEKHLRIRATFTDGQRAMHFVDQRTFGGMRIDELVPDALGILVPESVVHIAPDPLAQEFDLSLVSAAIASKSTEIKRILLDQNILSGIGNIYADEALWLSQIHGATRASSLNPERIMGLIVHATKVMEAALDQGGTSFDSLYVNVNGESGYFSRDLNAYGREKEPCNRCGTPMVRERFMNRSSFSCPQCQVRPVSK